MSSLSHDENATDDTSQDLVRTVVDPHHAKVRRALTELTGAGRAVLHTIHQAGGWHVFDPHHQAAMQRALAALEAATLASLSVPGINEVIE